LNSLFQNGWSLKSTGITDSFSYDDMKKNYNENILPLFLIDESERLIVSTIENPIEPKAGDLVIALVKEKNQ
jgi:hypothetical protein